MGGDEDPELEAIRRRKLMELQREQDYQAEAMRQAEVVEAQRQNILRGVLTPEARERLGRLKIAYPDVALQVEDRGCRKFAGLDTRLMIGVDIHQGRIKTDRSFKQRNQRADGSSRQFIDGNRQRLAPVLSQRRTRALETSRQMVPRGYTVFNPDLGTGTIAKNLDESHEEVVDSFA